ncbi:MAG TPA: Gfo/Idh/MocA family oxidoreductase [Pirellulaceae bacterium]
MKTSISRRQVLAASAAFGAAVASRAEFATADERKPRLKIGQIGVGHAHATKLSVYRESPDYEVVGIFEPDKELRERAKEQPAFRDVPFITEEQLLNTAGLSAVLVETHVRDLLSTAQRCVDAGKHIHLDKPAGNSLPMYRKLLDAAAKKNLLVQMGYMYRYSAAVVLLRQFLKDGWLGDVFEVHTVMSKVVGDAERKNLAQFPGGIMFELGCHVIDLVVGVVGKPDKVNAFPRHSGKQNDGLADNMLAALEYPKATATVKSSAEEVDGGSRRHFVVCGTSGTFHIQPLDNPGARVTLDRQRGEYKRGTHEVSFPKFTRYVGDAADMARIIRGEKETDFPYSHDLAVQQTVLLASGQGA